MPDQLTETPSDEELREYLIDNVKMSAIAWSMPESEFQTDRLNPAYVASLGAATTLAGPFLDRIVDTLFAALQRLNDVPRTDGFWDERNRRPTLYKLRDYNYVIIKKNPDDRLSLWTQAALYLLHGSTNFGAKQWRRLHYVGDFDVSWPILAALVTELNSESTVEPLVELLERIELEAEAKAFLATFDACGDAWIVEWRDAVVAALDR
jgi:hypothetical protein